MHGVAPQDRDADPLHGEAFLDRDADQLHEELVRLERVRPHDVVPAVTSESHVMMVCLGGAPHPFSLQTYEHTIAQRAEPTSFRNAQRREEEDAPGRSPTQKPRRRRKKLKETARRTG